MTETVVKVLKNMYSVPHHSKNLDRVDVIKTDNKSTRKVHNPRGHYNFLRIVCRKLVCRKYCVIFLGFVIMR